MAYRNIRLHPILHVIYFILRVLVWAGFRVFYRRRLVLGREHLRFDGPAIVITNHPSTLTDVLHPALSIHQEMFYLANYGMFKHPVANWLLRRLYCIPVKRREDVSEGENRNNYEAFEQSFRHLEQYGVLFIAAEGTSWMNRFVRPFKSGTARIAFGAEARNDWKLEVKIIPVGLSYSAPDRFRSDVVVQFGAPVYARDWAEAWAADRAKAVDDFTQHLENTVKSLCIHTRDEAGEQLITRLEEVLRHEKPLPQRAAFERSQGLTARYLDDQNIRESTNRYFEALAQHGLTDAGVSAATRADARRAAFSDTLLLILAFPLFAAGYLFWFLPCFTPWWLNKKMGLYVGYSSTVKIMTGLFTFPLALWGWYRLAVPITGSGWPALGFLLLFGLLGYVALWYQRLFARRQARQRAMARPEALRELAELRGKVVAAATA